MARISINTDKFSAALRTRGVDLDARRILLTQLTGSEQEKDLAEPANCKGFGRVRHFRFKSLIGWSDNPLPNYPAAKALGTEPTAELRAQVFQNAVCNWRCWYCYVDFNRLSGDRRYSEFMSAAELTDLLIEANPNPCLVDLSGGQPDLVPEWVPWMMRELISRGLENHYYLWSDDNLSNDYFWRYLSEDDRMLLRAYPKYGRVGCFKGFDEQSFAFNTAAAPEEFDRQFEIFKRLMSEGFDLYAYVTFTTPRPEGIADGMRRFCDRLQEIHPNVPLRTVPLKIAAFGPVGPRLNAEREASISIQQEVHAAWVEELSRRFSAEDRARSICEVPYR